MTSSQHTAGALAILVVIIALLATSITLGVLLAKEKDDKGSSDEAALGQLLVTPEAVTLWWVIFNNPENCIHAPNATDNIRCGPLDAFGPNFLETQAARDPDLSKIVVNTDSGFAMLYATGTVSDEQGKIHLQASIYKSEPDTPLLLPLNMDPMAQGVAFTNSKNAEVHAIVRRHGKYVDFSQTLTDTDDYCNDPLFLFEGSKSGETGNICADYAAVAYAPDEEGSKRLFSVETSEPLEESEAQLFRTGDSLQFLIDTKIFA